jgi:hypothetical protein
LFFWLPEFVIILIPLILVFMIILISLVVLFILCLIVSLLCGYNRHDETRHD